MIDTATVGLPLASRESRITVRQMLAYAAGLGDTSPAVFDDAAPGFVAHPALCVALEWPVISDPATAAALVPEAADRLRAVHLVQDSTFHRPVRAGDRLITSGTVSGVWRGSGGTRTACLLGTFDGAGTPVVTSRTVAVYRGVDACGPDRPANDEAPPPPPPAPGAHRELELDIEVDPALPHRYTECSGIWNPIHTERRVARAAGLPDIVVHGTASWALAGSAIVSQFAGGDPTRLLRLRGRFGALVFPGSTLRLRATARPDDTGCDVHFTVFTPAGDPAVADGYARVGAAGGAG